MNRRGARGVLIWTVAVFAIVQIAMVAGADVLAPEVYDPEYAARLARLQARRAEHPDRPLLVMLGSSRTCQLFRPEQLPPIADAGGRAVLPFNFSRAGGGPVYSRLAHSRLCQKNLKPDWVVIELMPALMTNRFERFFYTSVTAGELDDLARYISGRRAVGFYARLRFLPGYKNRTGFLRTLAPEWVLPCGADDDPEATVDKLGGEGKRIMPEITNSERRRQEARTIVGLADVLANFQIDPGADRALRDLLGECRKNGTGAVLVLSPESTALRAAYPPNSIENLNAYTADLTREFGVRVVDARKWLPDDEFQDGHHPILKGQATFTSRLHREVLVPLVSDASSLRR